MARTPRELKLSGVFASAITPHRASTPDADFSGSLDLLDFLAAAGVAGISLLDATGEFFDYSLSDRQRLVYLGVKRSRVPLIANVSHSTLSGAVHLADEAIGSGVDGLMIMPPYFFRYNQAELAEFFRQFADETGDAVPILLQHHPQSTSALEPETVAELMRTGRFAGIVDSSGDWQCFEQLLALKSSGFAVLCGADRLAVQALKAGANALVSPCASAIPELLVAIARGKQPLGALGTKLDEFIAWIERFPGPAGIKRAVELRGQKSGGSFVPLAPDTGRALDEFSSWFRTWLPVMKETIR
jgi:4-hydroxy-tetrahydrodipicolinate synthase